MKLYQRLGLVTGLATALTFGSGSDADAQTARAKKLLENQKNPPSEQVDNLGQHTYHLQSMIIQYDHGSGDIQRVIAFGSREPDPETGTIDQVLMDMSASRDGAIDNRANTNVIEFKKIMYQGDPNTTYNRAAYVEMVIHPSPLSTNDVAFTFVRGQTPDALFTAGSYETLGEVTLKGYVENLEIFSKDGQPSRNPKLDANSIIDNSRTYGQPVHFNLIESTTRTGPAILDVVVNRMTPAPGGIK